MNECKLAADYAATDPPKSLNKEEISQKLILLEYCHSPDTL